MAIRTTLLFLFASLQCSMIFGQTKKLDSLKQIVDAATGNDNKLAAIVAYCEDYPNMHRDSLERYTLIALDLAQQTKDEHLKNLAALTLAQDYMRWGWADSVLYTVNNELPKNPVTNKDTRDIFFRLYRLKAVAYASGGQLQESLEVLYKLLPEAEKYKDTLTLVSTCNSIGTVAIKRKEPGEAKKWNDRALQYYTDANAKYFGSVYVSRAQLYNLSGDADSALIYLSKGIDFCIAAENLDRLTAAYRLQSSIYTNTGRLKEAETALMNMLETRKKTNDNPDAVVNDNLQIAEFYAATGQLKKAIQLCKSKLVTGDLHKKNGEGEKAFTNDPAVQLPYYEALAGYLKEDKDYTGYQETLEKIIELKDTLSEINKTEAIAELQTRYDVEQKENKIISQQLALTKRNYLLYGSVGFTIMAAIIAGFIFQNQRRKQKEKIKFTIETEKKIAAESILEAEEKERKRIAADLHDNIGAYATAIRDDVDKISSSKEKTLPHFDNLRQHSQEIINSLRDTIWVLNKENITITGISDRIKNYISKLQPSYPGISINIHEDIKHDFHVPSQRALNIFRIVQEAVHNAIKYSNSDIDIFISGDEQVKISVTDGGNGIGEINRNNGNGLTNMKERAAEAGMQLSSSSAENQGTTVTIETAT